MTTETAWSVELEQRVSGPPDAVFQYFIDPEKYRRWQGIDAELDPRPGGIFKVTQAPGFRIRGEYLAVERPHRIVLSWGFESDGMQLPHAMEQVPPGSSRLEFAFVEDGDGTIIRLRHTGLPSELARWAHKLGWDLYLVRVAIIQRGENPGDDPILTLAEALYAKDAELASGHQRL